MYFLIFLNSKHSLLIHSGGNNNTISTSNKKFDIIQVLFLILKKLETIWKSNNRENTAKYFGTAMQQNAGWLLKTGQW